MIKRRLSDAKFGFGCLACGRYLAIRRQTSVPEVTDLSDEPDYIFDRYSEDARDPGTFAANCLMARRPAERDVKFIQLYHLDGRRRRQKRLGLWANRRLQL